MYIQVTDNNLTAWGAYPFDDFTKEIPEIDYNDFIQNREKYIFQDENIVLNPNWETEQQTKEKEPYSDSSKNWSNFASISNLP